ncbi:transmembrane protein 186 [Periophthalmus magnuspinnatus]|uniref:transmembrane protein 186 n=1 Tax=Periophthalmus magnuspinnatus TaxID=409849 RepID=UPI002436C350|nr:transmembrane protein 186 [Periophthalmus magnuspinnatus]
MMRSLMLRRLSSHLLTCTRGLCPGPVWMSCGIHAQLTTIAKYSNNSTPSYTMIYRLPHIKLLRAVSRLKLLQTGITVVILPPVYYLYLQGDLSLFFVCYSTGIAGFAGLMLYTASHFFRRVVGMMYLDPSQTTLKVSHLTFWGKRSDLFLPVSDVMTIADTGDATTETILRLKTYSGPETLYFSTYYGRIVDPEGFEKVFGRSK